METILTLPVRCSIILAIAALVGTSFSQLTRHFDAPPGQILASQTIVNVPATAPAEEPVAEEPLPPFNLFTPVIIAGVLLFAWQAADFRKSWKRAKADNLHTNAGSRKTAKQRNLRR